MANPNRKWPRITAMVVAAVVLTGALALVLVEQFAPDQALVPKSLVSLPGRIVSAALKPMQSAFAWVTDGVTGYLENLKLQKNIEIAYNNLKAQNDQLIYDSLYIEELEIKNEQYERLLDIYDEYQTLNPVVASVIERETGNWYRMFTINKGKNDDIKANMAVVHEKGLVGYVYKVADTTSQVITIIDNRASVSGMIQSSREQGVVRGTLGVEDEPTCRMYYLPVDSVPRPGDIVVTSGIGLPFPSGIRIGTIRESTRHTDENKRYVVIDPEVDFQRLEEVIVLVYVPTAEEMPDSDDGQVHYVPGTLDTPRPSASMGAEIADPNLGAVTTPPRATRRPTSDLGGDAGGDIYLDHYLENEFGDVVDPDATPTPNPELDALMREELENDGFLEGDD